MPTSPPVAPAPHVPPPVAPPGAPAPHIAPPGAPGGWGARPRRGPRRPEDPLRTAAQSAQQLWEQPQAWDPQPHGAPPAGGPYPGAPHPAGPYGVGPYGQPYGQPQWGPVRPAPGSVPQPQPLKTAVGMMWIGAGITILGSLSTFLVMDQVRDDVEDQLMADGQVVSESTLDAAVTVGLVVGFAIALGDGRPVGVDGDGQRQGSVVGPRGRHASSQRSASCSACSAWSGSGLNGATGTSLPGLVQNLITIGPGHRDHRPALEQAERRLLPRQQLTRSDGDPVARSDRQRAGSSRCRWACCPSRSNTMISSATPSRASTEWGVMVENSAASPSTTSTSRSPSVRRTRPLRTNIQS